MEIEPIPTISAPDISTTPAIPTAPAPAYSPTRYMPQATNTVMVDFMKAVALVAAARDIQ